MHRLGKQPKMPHHGNPSLHQSRGRMHRGAASFDLHRSRSAFLDQASGVAQRIFRADLIGEERHVCHHQRPLDPAGNRSRVMHHGVQCHGQRCFVTEHHHAQRIADQQHIDTRTIQQPGHRIVIRRQHGDFLATLFPGLQIG